jgi:hypothetical protein
MMVALAISAALTAAALAASGHLWRDEAAGRSREEKDSVREGLGSLLERDFIHAERSRREANAISLRTHTSLDVKSLERDYVPATISYQVRQIGGQLWLVRVQQVAQAAPFMELVAPDVRSVSIKETGGAETADWRQMPAATTVVATMMDGRTLEYTFRTK